MDMGYEDRWVTVTETRSILLRCNPFKQSAVNTDRLTRHTAHYRIHPIRWVSAFLKTQQMPKQMNSNINQCCLRALRSLITSIGFILASTGVLCLFLGELVHSSSLWCNILKSLLTNGGMALIVAGIFDIIIGCKMWKKFFEQVLIKIYTEKDYLRGCLKIKCLKNRCSTFPVFWNLRNPLCF